jgi:enoyl-CoA hydratase/carnithine racemase
VSELWGSTRLDIGPDGRPGTAVRPIRLADWFDAPLEQISETAASIRRSLPLTIGITSEPPPPRVRPIIEALTLTLCSTEIESPSGELIQVTDPETSYEGLRATVEANPQAAVALGQLLRQTPDLETTAALAAEAAVYSMLLGGREFADWLSGAGERRAANRLPAARVRLQRSDNRLTVQLDHPTRRNALSVAMREELFCALELAVLDEQITSVALSGAGESFCSGGDLAEFGTADDLVAAYLVRLDRAPWRLLDDLKNRLDERLLVRVNGAVIGAGAEMAAFGGRVICTQATYFQLPEISMGLVPGAGGTVSITRRIGRWRAAWIMLTGHRIDAETALRWGLVDELESTEGES